MKKGVMSVLQKRNEQKMTLLEKTCTDAVSIFNQTIEKLELAANEYKALENDINAEINELTQTKTTITNKISNLSKITAKFKDLLA